MILYTVVYWLSLLGYWLLITVIILRILMKCRAVSSAMAWFLIIYILPLIGVIVYLSIGELHLSKSYIRRISIIWSSTVRWFRDNVKFYKNIFVRKNDNISSSLFRLCEYRQGIAGVKDNQLQLFTNYNKVIKTLINDIQLAKSNIEIVFYIWQPGGMVDQVAQSLIAAELRGIHCRLMLDSAGSVAFFRDPWAKKMRKVGIEVIEVLKINFLYAFLRRMDLRQHRKIVLIDNYIAYTGSMNMVDPRYFKQNSHVGQWVDIMVRMEGPVVDIMSIVYSCDWEIETGKRIYPFLYKTNITKFKHTNECNIHIIASGPGFPKNLIHQALLTATYAARKYLIITTPYFIPSDSLLHAICTAAQRGVDVSIILPHKNDSILVEWASRTFFSELLSSGVKIYQFKGGLLHTKSILIDGKLSLVGTVNLDMRSLWINFEITLVIDSIDFSNNLATVQYDYISRSKLLNAYVWNKRPFWKKIIERLFYLFSPLL